MDCNEARPLLDANADHELPAPEARRVQQHIESCEACRRESENLRAMSGALRAAPYHRASQALRARIVAGLPDTESVLAGGASASSEMQTQQAPQAAAGGEPARERRPSSGRASGWFDRWFGGRASQGGQGGFGGFGRPLATGGPAGPLASGWLAALVIAVCAIGVTLTLNLRRPAEFAPFADELVSSHVRAQVSGRDIDVISTDRHTVKPWFNGRLDYSPPVEDLAASGFALQGGRLDYLAHRRVAVLVYRYRKHVIDVYVFPQTAGADVGAPARQAQEGFSIAHWNAEGMTWWAVTDAAPDALSGLEAALKARLQGGSERTEGG
ncbi:anti-sigma factor [Paraburkholderia sp. MPAMCS5]|uniref:anti-sigma factor family protein n=1 Tax=Paraburkholderia sp. MPAMCS5 TaxID=3112563 RepID=UPI002E16CD8E|nr:anti-sigma factor [Paraburkholderia sp. MPAMCS5]